MPPGTPDKEYVQWQRGPKSDTPIEEMNSWIDTLHPHRVHILVTTIIKDKVNLIL